MGDSVDNISEDRSPPEPEDEELVLSTDTLAALHEFLSDKQAAEEAAAADPFAENWALSQFWYDDETASTVAAEVVRAAKGQPIACIACPSLFRALRAGFPEVAAQLLEYDPRFAVLGSFTLYDYNHPLEVPGELKHSFGVVVADPPYLSEECLVKTALTMRLLAAPADPPRLYLLTGAVQRQLAYRLLNLRPVRFRPQHRNKLGNEFLLYASALSSEGSLGGWDSELDPASEGQR